MSEPWNPNPNRKNHEAVLWPLAASDGAFVGLKLNLPMPSSLKHDLRTPLNHILGYCEMLLEEAQDKHLDHFIPDLERIHAAGRRLLTVINDLFDPAKEGPAPIAENVLHHELRTPLNHIIGYAEILREEAIERGQESFMPDIDKIHAAAHQLLQLVMEKLMPVLMGGGLEAPSEDSSPTTFVRKSDVAAPSAPFMTAATAAPSGAGRLLVVDDIDLNRDMLARRLTRLGFIVEQAAHGREALDKLQQHSFDLMLLDIMMPVMNGYDVLSYLKSDPTLSRLPVIVLSASDETHKIVRCIEMGAEDYLPKPFDPVLLQTRINACLEKKRLRDQEVLHLRQIEEEKRRSEELLHVILPEDVAAELKETQGVQPRRHEHVGVLFCDIAGFTSYCDRHPPERVLPQLQALVETFEGLTLQHGLEKIKTIGDSFMAAAGLLDPLENPALHGVRCGLAMIAAAAVVPPHWHVRVGVHVGPVIAGVVGRRKYQYDIWGDTVNTAARMQAAAAPGTICVSEGTWKLLQPYCHGTSLGRVSIKGKGEQELFRVDGLMG